MSFELSEIARRLENLIIIGTVIEIDGAFARCVYGDEEVETDLLPWLTQRAGDDRTWHAPSEGEQVLILSASGDPAQGVILMSLYQNGAAAPASDSNIHRIIYADGTTISYDKAAHTLTATLCDNGKMNIKAPGGFVFTGDAELQGKLTVSETIEAQGDISSAGDVSDAKGTVQENRDVFNEHKGHTASGTLKPVTKMGA